MKTRNMTNLWRLPASGRFLARFRLRNRRRLLVGSCVQFPQVLPLEEARHDVLAERHLLLCKRCFSRCRQAEDGCVAKPKGLYSATKRIDQDKEQTRCEQQPSAGAQKGEQRWKEAHQCHDEHWEDDAHDLQIATDERILKINRCVVLTGSLAGSFAAALRKDTDFVSSALGSVLVNDIFPDMRMAQYGCLKRRRGMIASQGIAPRPM